MVQILIEKQFQINPNIWLLVVIEYCHLTIINLVKIDLLSVLCNLLGLYI